MVCIYCGARTKIINSRPLIRNNQTWRRHHCQNCHATFSSIESCQLDSSLLVVSQNGRTEPFIRDKLFISLYKAIEMLENSEDKADHLTQTVINALLGKKPLNALISTKDIQKTVLRVLKHYNAAAAIRYASTRVSMPLVNDVKRVLRG